MPEIYVSIVIPTFNSSKTINKCLSSIKVNKNKYNYELIVVDADSTDDTLEIARPYVNRILKGEPGRINRNIGIQIARGEIICFTDSDCIVPPDWIDKLTDGLLRLHDRDENVVGVGGGSILKVENPNLMELAVLKAMNSPLVSFQARNLAIYNDERAVLHNPPMNSACFKWALEQVDGFQEKYGYGGEDLELDAKLISRGYKLYYLPDINVWHEHRAGWKKYVTQMYKHGKSRVRVGHHYRQYLQFHHYGPIFLCLLSVTPLLFIPLGMALINGTWVSLQEKRLRLFLWLVLLTWSFYIAYGLGEITELLKRSK